MRLARQEEALVGKEGTATKELSLFAFSNHRVDVKFIPEDRTKASQNI